MPDRSGVRAVRRMACLRDDKVDGVADYDAVVDQEASVRVLENGLLNKLAVAMAVAGVGILPCAADFHSAVLTFTALHDVPPRLLVN